MEETFCECSARNVVTKLLVVIVELFFMAAPFFEFGVLRACVCDARTMASFNVRFSLCSGARRAQERRRLHACVAFQIVLRSGSVNVLTCVCCTKVGLRDAPATSCFRTYM